MTTWMVVEDEPDVYELLLAMFDLWGIEGVAFITKEETLAWIDDVDNGRFQGELPDMGLIDIKLPDDDDGGIIIAERLRKSPVLGSIAIVFVTANKYTPEERRSIYARTSPDEWIQKPLPTFDELRVILDDVLARKGKQSTSAENSKPANGSTADDMLDDDFLGVDDDDWVPVDEPLPTFDGLDDQTDSAPSSISSERRENNHQSSRKNNNNHGGKSNKKPRNDSSR